MKDNKTSKASSSLIFHTIEELQKSAFDSFEHLKKQQERIVLFKADLDLLKKRYNTSKSLFGTVADWYNAQSLWKQVIFAVLLFAAAILIGALAGIFFTYSLLLIGGASIYLLQDHHQTEEKRAELFCSDILKMEADLTQSVASLNAIEDKLFKLFQVLSEKNIEYASSITDFKEKVKYLQEQIEFFEQTVKELKEINATILADTKEVHASGKELRQQLSELHQKFTNSKIEQEICDKMRRIQDLLQRSEMSLTQNIYDLTQDTLASKADSDKTKQVLITGKASVNQSKATLSKAKALRTQMQKEANNSVDPAALSCRDSFFSVGPTSLGEAHETPVGEAGPIL